MQEPLLISSSEPENKQKTEKLKYFYKASTLSRLFFSWISVLIEYGNKNELKQENLQDLKMEDRAEQVYEQWASVWVSEQHKQNATQPLKQSIKATFKHRFIIGIITDFFAYTLTIMTPVLIYLISTYLMKNEKTVGEGIMWLVIVSLVRFLRSFCDGHGNYKLTQLGADVGNTMALGMVKKSLKYSVLCNKKFKMGQLANLLQVDCFRLGQFPKNLSSVINIIYVLVFSVCFMGFLVQASFLAGFAVILVASVINMVVSRRNSVYQKDIANGTDNRMKSTNQVFNNIKFIKVNAWQEYFYDKLQRLRKEEVTSYKKKFMIETISTFSMWLTPKMILVATFGTFVATGGDLTAPVAFSFMSLFAYMQFYLQFLPNSLSVVMESANAVRRIQNYLQAEQINLSCITHTRYEINENKDSIVMENGNFYWDKSAQQIERIIPDNSYHLRDLNFRIKKGQMVAIIGGIGTGKSSLLYSLLGQMKFPTNQYKPKLTINGSMSLVTQKPWIVNDTVRNNIVFGKQYNRKKYQDVIHYACLKRDFELFTHGDKTMIGQKGSTLSGGQKARISFARSLYSESDILLLDDLLSAVDVHVGKFMMTQTLLKYAKTKTRILVTHALYYLKYVDKVIIMDEGRVVQQGSYDKIRNSTRFRQIYQAMMKDQKKKRSQSADLLQEIAEQTKVQDKKQMKKQQQVPDEAAQQTTTKISKSTSNLSHIQEKANKQQVNVKLEDPAINQLMMAQQSGGQAGWGLYRSYAQYNGGTLWIVAILFSMFGWLIFNTCFNIWLSVWTADNGDHPNGYYVGYYAMFGVLYGLFAFFRAIILAISTPKMSEVIHESMISNLLFSPLNEFFDRVPLGRILNRLSKDVNTIDASLANVFANFLVFLFFLLGNVVVIVYCTSIWILIPILAFLIGITILKNYFMKPNKELVRLQGITKSPVISCFTQILNGVATIRAYGVESSFFVKNCIKINQNKKPCIAQKAAEVWFTMRLTFLSFIINVSALSIVLFTDIADASQASLLLVVSLGFDQITYFLLTNQSSFENELISLERCETFMKLTPQKGYVQYLKNREISKIKSKERRSTPDQNSNWPDKGQIKFINYKVKYRPNLDLVLRGLTVTFQGGHKIGVVGRTGSGKSTIMMSLLRILQAYDGQIILDGKDISKISLDDLRSKITIILQDPCLFAGTLRENLDPLSEYSDKCLWGALEMTALKETMEERKGLQSEITENGQNLSVGQRQLISIARAIIKPTKIVLVDQATANIDVKTQSVIYKAMNEAFKNSTVITVAHRLNTVINSDRILVLEGGLLKEYDNPQALLKNPNSFFASLYNESQKESKM